MWRLLDKLRQKSDQEKQNIAFFISISVTLVIIVVWISTFNIDTSTVTATTSSPMEGFSEKLTELWNSRPSFTLSEQEIPEELKEFPNLEQN